LIARFPPFNYTDPPVLAEKLYAAIPPSYRPIIQLVFAEAEKQGTHVYLVGGIVRDLFLLRPNYDYDFVCMSYAPTFAKALTPLFEAIKEVTFIKLTEHETFGTANFELEIGDLPILNIDIATSRRETYAHPAALPTVQINPPAPVELDMGRRDFSINAMAVSPGGGLVDPLGGLADLRDGYIRVLHAKSFEDDPTRMVRGVRYAARFGYKFTESTEKLLLEAWQNNYFNLLSAERKRNELRLILREANPMRALALLQEYRLLENIHPLLRWDEAKSQQMTLLKSSLGEEFNSTHGLMVLLSDLGAVKAERVVQNLRFAGTEATFPVQFARLVNEPVNQAQSNRQLYRLLKSYANEVLKAFIILRPDIAGKIEVYLNDLQYRKPKLGGDYLKSLGMLPSPRFKQVLDELLDAVMDGEVKTIEDEARFLRTRNDER
jgi:tRNA nucleotidyltransferase (CCA-adding enzyme)